MVQLLTLTRAIRTAMPRSTNVASRAYRGWRLRPVPASFILRAWPTQKIAKDTTAQTATGTMSYCSMVNQVGKWPTSFHHWYSTARLASFRPNSRTTAIRKNSRAPRLRRPEPNPGLDKSLELPVPTIHEHTVHDSGNRTALESLSMEWCVAALRVRLVNIVGPGEFRIENGEIARSTGGERPAAEFQDAGLPPRKELPQ